MSRTGSLNFENMKVIEVHVKPNSRENLIYFDEEKKVYIACVKAQAEDGKANSELLKILKKESGKTGKIISGAASRKKLIKLE